MTKRAGRFAEDCEIPEESAQDTPMESAANGQPVRPITRWAALPDSDAIFRLWRRFMAEEADAVPHPQVEQVERRWRQRLREQIAASKVIVVEIAGAVCGFLGFIDSADRSWVPPGVAYVVDIYVAPKARRSTAARDLFFALLETEVRVYSEVWTNVNARNKRMKVLLERVRFIPLSDFAVPRLTDQVYYRLPRRNA